MTAAEQLDREVRDLEQSLGDHLAADGRLAVVKAPPGSGKTFVLISVLMRLLEEGMGVAVAAQTNSQADDICRRIAARDPAAGITRFASSGHRRPDDLPALVVWTSDKADLTPEHGVTVSTSAKWALTDVLAPFDVLAVDEAWQMAWADLMQCATLSERFLLIGDPGQIPPVVSIDVRRWETSPRSPHDPAPEVILGDPELTKDALIGSLPACRRLPHESVNYIRPFYDFAFEAFMPPGARGLDLPSGHRLEPLADGSPLTLTLPTPAAGPPLEVDPEVAAAAAQLVDELLEGDILVRADDNPRSLTAADIGVTSTHRVMNAAILSALGGRHPEVRVDTPERWQGLERPVMIGVHPLSGVVDPSAFDLDTGRLCVMASRHQAAHIILARDHIGKTLSNVIPSAEQAPGRPDVVGRGHDAHTGFWDQLESAGRLLPFS